MLFRSVRVFVKSRFYLVLEHISVFPAAFLKHSRRHEFPLFGKELSRADFEEKLKEHPANDHLKVVVTEKQSVQTPSEEKPDSIKSVSYTQLDVYKRQEIQPDP